MLCSLTDLLPPSAFCGHIGFTAISSLFDALGEEFPRSLRGL